jgi:hypothetical protein
VGSKTNVVLFLLDILANGAVAKSVVEKRAAARGFSIQQLDRAKKRMGIVTFKEGGKFEGQWFWRLNTEGAGGENDAES